MSIFKIFRILGLTTAWAEKATADGKIDKQEIFELVSLILDIAGVKAEIQIDMD
jgi:hypothetical protein